MECPVCYAPAGSFYEVMQARQAAEAGERRRANVALFESQMEANVAEVRRRQAKKRNLERGLLLEKVEVKENELMEARDELMEARDDDEMSRLTIADMVMFHRRLQEENMTLRKEITRMREEREENQEEIQALKLQIIANLINVLDIEQNRSATGRKIYTKSDQIFSYQVIYVSSVCIRCKSRKAPGVLAWTPYLKTIRTYSHHFFSPVFICKRRTQNRRVSM